MKTWLILGACVIVALATLGGCVNGTAPASTSTPTPGPAVTTTPTPPPSVIYVEARFESGPSAGKEITVPVASSIDVSVILKADAIMRGELKVEVWRKFLGSPDTLVQSSARATTLQSGTQRVAALQFDAEDMTGKPFSHYYLKAFWNGVALVSGPMTGEGVKVSGYGTATPNPTLLPTREWNLEGVKVDGSTVVVTLRVFAGIDVRATLDGRQADEVRPVLPMLEYIFRNVAQGTHSVVIKDVVGHQESVEVFVPSSGIPEWLASLIQKMASEPVANPPASITRYEYKGQIVYYVPPRFADIYSDLYDANGNLIGHPDGGITGKGDGRVPDFFKERTNETIIWKDLRTR